MYILVLTFYIVFKLVGLEFELLFGIQSWPKERRIAACIKDTKKGVVFWNNGFIRFCGTTTCVRCLCVEVTLLARWHGIFM